MADGGRADQEMVIEAVARRIAAALGRGNNWRPQWYPSASGLEDERGEVFRSLSIVRRSYVEEKAVRGDGHIKVPRLRSWTPDHGVVMVPNRRPDFDALAAFSFAKLDGPLEAILLLYATGDVQRYWPVVERFGLACVRGEFAFEALTDAVQRILCGRAAISQDARARSIGIRASGYRAATQAAEHRLRGWLLTASTRFLAALG